MEIMLKTTSEQLPELEAHLASFSPRLFSR